MIFSKTWASLAGRIAARRGGNYRTLTGLAQQMSLDDTGVHSNLYDNFNFSIEESVGLIWAIIAINE